jgi:hypothetical protein
VQAAVDRTAAYGTLADGQGVDASNNTAGQIANAVAQTLPFIFSLFQSRARSPLRSGTSGLREEGAPASTDGSPHGGAPRLRGFRRSRRGCSSVPAE